MQISQLEGMVSVVRSLAKISYPRKSNKPMKNDKEYKEIC